MDVIDEGISEPLGEPPLIGPAEQRLFAIEDTRERADRLQELLVPKLTSLLDEACDWLREVYGDDVLSPCRMPTTPAHRPGAKKTQSFEFATAGLAVNGQAWFFQQRCECTSDSLHIRIFGLRGLEGNPIVQVMKRHTEEVVRLLEHVDFEVRSATIDDSDEAKELDLATSISRLRIVPDREWEGTYIIGPALALPIRDHEAAWPVLYDFVALFPIFRAATHVLQGEDDRFQYYSERSWKWKVQPEEDEGGDDPSAENDSSTADPIPPHTSDTLHEDDDSALEGGFKFAIQRHREREKRLRRKKIREAIRQNDGRLRCEVPGCGFDFVEIYGELGRDFAHVHHKNPLSDRTSPELTRLSDLAIVCANCHAMIHRGGLCRALENLMPRRE